MKAMRSLQPYKRVAAACVAAALLCGAGIAFIMAFAQGTDHILTLGYSEMQDAWAGPETVEASDFTPYHYAESAPVTVTMEGDAVLEQEPQGNDTVHTYHIHRDLIPIIERLEFPLGSATMKKQVLEAMEDKLPVHFFDHDETGCHACQALALLDPETGSLSVIGLNSKESGHTLALILEEREDSASSWARFGDGRLQQQEASLEALTDEELAALLADPNVDVELRETILRHIEDGEAADETTEQESSEPDGPEESPADPAESEPEEQGGDNTDNDNGPDQNGEQDEQGALPPGDDNGGQAPDEPLTDEDQRHDGNDSEPADAWPDNQEQDNMLPDNAGGLSDEGLPDEVPPQWEDDADSEQDWEDDGDFADSARDDERHGDLAVEPMVYHAAPARALTAETLATASPGGLRLTTLSVALPGQEPPVDGTAIPGEPERVELEPQTNDTDADLEASGPESEGGLDAVGPEPPGDGDAVGSPEPDDENGPPDPEPGSEPSEPETGGDAEATHKAIVLRATEETLPGTEDGEAEITRLAFAAPGNGLSLLLVDIAPMAAPTGPVATFAELKDALEKNTAPQNTDTSELVIELASDIPFSEGEFLHFYLSRDITFRSSSTGNRTISPASGLATMLVAVDYRGNSPKTLAFEDVTIDGKDAGGGIFTYTHSGAKGALSDGLTIRGAKLHNCKYSWEVHKKGSATGTMLEVYGALFSDFGTDYEIEMESGFGGGALLLGNTTVAGDTNTNTLDRCEFKDNTSNGYGGAVYCNGVSTVKGEDYCGTTFQNCTFTNNESISNGGGAIFFEGSQHALAFNQVIDCTFTENESQIGGAIFIFDNGHLEIGGETVFTKNTATHEGGGGVCVYRNCTLRMQLDADVRFIGNKATGSMGGGGILAEKGSILKLEQGALVVEDNTADKDGGGINLQPECTLYLDGTNDGTSIQNNWADRGGGLYLNAAILHLSGDTTLGTDNHTTGGGGGGICTTGDSTIQNSSLTITGNYTGQTASANRGGGIYVYSGTLTLADGLNLTVADNNALFGGGIALNQNATLASDGTGVQLTVKGNQALLDSSVQYSGIGGGVFLASGARWEMDEGDALIVGDKNMIDDDESNDVPADGNTATANGGGLYVATGGTINLPGKAVIAGNTAGGSGGGFYLGNTARLDWTSSLVNASGSVIIQKNQAAANGGGIYYGTGAESTLASAVGSFEYANFSVTGNEATGLGGGIYLAGGNTVEAFLNGASGYGTQLDISLNTASSGGGVYVARDESTVRNDEHNSIIAFDENTSTDDGAGLYVNNDATLRLENASPPTTNNYLGMQLINNKATGLGGGAYVGATGKLLFQRSHGDSEVVTISGNTARYGGGIYLAYDGGATPVEERLVIGGGSGRKSILAENKADKDGGAIYVVLNQNADGTPDYSDSAYLKADQANRFQAVKLTDVTFYNDFKSLGNKAGGENNDNYQAWKTEISPTPFHKQLKKLWEDGVVVPVDTSYTTLSGGKESGNTVFNNADINCRVPKVYDLTFRKVDGSDRSKKLDGAVFQLYLCDDSHSGGSHTDHPGETGTCWKNPQTAEETTTDGLVKFTDLTPGDYALVETVAPEGYQLPAGYWTFTMDGNGTITAPKGVMQPAAIVQAADGDEASYLITNNPPLAMPLTGFGQYFLFAGGVMLLLTGWLVLRRARQEEY